MPIGSILLCIINIKFSQIFKRILNCNLLTTDVLFSFFIVVTGSLEKRIIKMTDQIEALINDFSESPNGGITINYASISINEYSV